MEDTTPFEDVTFEEVVDENPDPDPDPSPTDEEEQEDQPTQEEETQEDSPEEEDEPTDEDLDSQDEPDDTEEEDNQEEEEETQASVMDAIQAKTGFETEEDYSDDIDGVAEYINDVATQQAQSQVEQLVESLPEDVQTFMQYRANGGDPEEFMETYTSNWNETELQEDNSSQHEKIVRNRMKEEGWDEEDIESAIEDYKTSGNLYGEAKRSLNRLQKLEEQQKENLIEQQEQRQQEQQKEIEEAWNEIENTLNNTSELNGMPIPENQKDPFFEWMSQPVDEKNGQPVSQRDIAAQNADVETLLTLDYVMYLMNHDDLSFDDVISQKAKTENAKGLEDLLSNSNNKDTPSDKSKGPSGGDSSKDVDANDLPNARDLIG